MDILDTHFDISQSPIDMHLHIFGYPGHKPFFSQTTSRAWISASVWSFCSFKHALLQFSSSFRRRPHGIFVCPRWFILKFSFTIIPKSLCILKIERQNSRGALWAPAVVTDHDKKRGLWSLCPIFKDFSIFAIDAVRHGAVNQKVRREIISHGQDFQDPLPQTIC